MHDPVRPLARDATFRFACSPDVACFNACCRDLQQVLTPYDVLCLKQFLRLSSSEFLKRFTAQATGPGTGLPVVCLHFDPEKDLVCPFVTPAGCSVYPARPASCRTYPLARGVSRNRVTGERIEHWAVIRESHCLGFRSDREQTVDAWVDDQKIAAHNRFNDMMLDLIARKNRMQPGPLTPAAAGRVYTALYDLDNFREVLFREADMPAAVAGMPAVEAAHDDDTALLRVAMAWVEATILTTGSRS